MDMGPQAQILIKRHDIPHGVCGRGGLAKSAGGQERSARLPQPLVRVLDQASDVVGAVALEGALLEDGPPSSLHALLRERPSRRAGGLPHFRN